MNNRESPPVDTTGPWTIKSFPTEERRWIVRTAEEQHITVGQWIEQQVKACRGNPVGNQVNGNSETEIEVLLGLLNTPGAPKWLRAGAARRLGGLLGIEVPKGRPGAHRRLAAPEGRGEGGGS